MKFLEGILVFAILLVVFPLMLLREALQDGWEEYKRGERLATRILVPIATPFFFILDAAQETWDELMDD